MVARTLRSELLMPGGLATTMVASGQQWNQPNGWAPLQWIGVVGLKDYRMSQLAETIARRWTCENIDGYQRSGTLVEKYNLIQGGGGSGGEYALQVGFGWTNGVLRALASLYPKLSSLDIQHCKQSESDGPYNSLKRADKTDRNPWGVGAKAKFP
jgi:alpha,alpha-trehalase